MNKTQWVVVSSSENDATVVYGPWDDYDTAKTWFNLRCDQHPDADHVLTSMYDPTYGVE